MPGRVWFRVLNLIHKLWAPPHCIREQTPTYAKQSHGEEKKKKFRHANKQKESEQVQEQVWWDVTDGDMLHEPRHRVCGGQAPLQSSQEAKLSLSPRTSSIKALAPWFMDTAPSSSKKWEEVWAETSPVPSNIHNIHWCTATTDLC